LADIGGNVRQPQRPGCGGVRLPASSRCRHKRR
jgi:hypothetical protein